MNSEQLQNEDRLLVSDELRNVLEDSTQYEKMRDSFVLCVVKTSDGRELSGVLTAAKIDRQSLRTDVKVPIEDGLSFFSDFATCAKASATYIRGTSVVRSFSDAEITSLTLLEIDPKHNTCIVGIDMSVHLNT